MRDASKTPFHKIPQDDVTDDCRLNASREVYAKFRNLKMVWANGLVS